MLPPQRRQCKGDNSRLYECCYQVRSQWHNPHFPYQQPSDWRQTHTCCMFSTCIVRDPAGSRNIISLSGISFDEVWAFLLCLLQPLHMHLCTTQRSHSGRSSIILSAVCQLWTASYLGTGERVRFLWCVTCQFIQTAIWPAMVWTHKLIQMS